MNILITGSKGYLASRLVQYLSNFDGYNILIAGRGIFDVFSHEKVSSKAIDWNNYDDLLSVTKNIDVVIHLAGMNFHQCASDPIKAIEFNVISTLRLANASAKNKVPKFLFFSTAHVYKSPLEGYLDEYSSTLNYHPYAYSNKAAEDTLLYLHEESIIEVFILRLSNVVGYSLSQESQCWDLITNDLCKQFITKNSGILRTSGEQERDFISITNILRVVNHFLLIKKKFDFPVFNISLGKSMKVKNIAKLIKEKIEKKLCLKVSLITNPSDKLSYGKLTLSNKKLLNTGFIFEDNLDQEIENLVLQCNNFFR